MEKGQQKMTKPIKYSKYLEWEIHCQFLVRYTHDNPLRSANGKIDPLICDRVDFDEKDAIRHIDRDHYKRCLDCGQSCINISANKGYCDRCEFENHYDGLIVPFNKANIIRCKRCQLTRDLVEKALFS